MRNNLSGTDIFGVTSQLCLIFKNCCARRSLQGSYSKYEAAAAEEGSGTAVQFRSSGGFRH